jgi:hypothetical protein
MKPIKRGGPALTPLDGSSATHNHASDPRRRAADHRDTERFSGRHLSSVAIGALSTRRLLSAEGRHMTEGGVSHGIHDQTFRGRSGSWAPARSLVSIAERLTATSQADGRHVVPHYQAADEPIRGLVAELAITGA